MSGHQSRLFHPGTQEQAGTIRTAISIIATKVALGHVEALAEAPADLSTSPRHSTDRSDVSFAMIGVGKTIGQHRTENGCSEHAAQIAREDV